MDRRGNVAGAQILHAVGDFGPQQSINGSTSGSFGDIAVGADGQVAVTYQKGSTGKAKVAVNIDPDGLGPSSVSLIAAACAALGIPFFWMPPGTESEAALETCRQNGVTAIHGFCPVFVLKLPPERWGELP